MASPEMTVTRGGDPSGEREAPQGASPPDASAPPSDLDVTSAGGLTPALERARRLIDRSERLSGYGALTRLLESGVAFARRHLRLMDSLVALSIFGIGLLNNLRGPDSPAAILVFTSLLALPLAGRRRAPIAVFLFIAGVAFAQWLDHVPLFADTALIVALYGVAVARPPLAAIGATAVLEGGALLAALQWSPAGSWLQTLALLSGVVAAAVVSGVHVRARHLYVVSLLERASRLELERDQQARLAAAAERARIAREMHDVIAHTLAVVVSLANGATAKLRREPEESRDALESISELGRQALEDTRQLLTVLRTDDGAETRAPQPGVDEISDLVDHAASTGLAATLTVRGDPAPVGTGPALSAYRIVQEAITNTLKHADGATAVAVELVWAPRRLQISIQDDGRAGVPSPPLGGGFGVAGMRERAAVHGGGAAAGPMKEGGWSVTASLPLMPRDPA